MTTETPEKASRQRMLEQRRAGHAWGCVDAVKRRHQKAKEYSSLVRGAPADILTSGLGQTLAFWRAKGFENSRPSANEHAWLYADVSAWVRSQIGLAAETDLLRWVSQDATTDDYRRATAEALAMLAWLRRFAEAELPREGTGGAAGDQTDGGDA